MATATVSKSGKIFTENPFIDELIYYVKQIAPNCVIKNEELADSNETLESIKAADLYIASYEGRAEFYMFDSFPREVLRLAKVPEESLDICVEDKTNIPEKYRSAVVTKMMSYYIDNYVDLNNYYRMITGYPDTDDTDYIYLNDYVEDEDRVDLTLPLHEQSSNTISMLKEDGTLDKIKEDNPTKDYLNYIDKDISIYNARIAARFQLLYSPVTESDIINAKWKDKYALNRDYILRTVYSEAFKKDSDYYDSIITVLIITQTMIDIIGEVQEHIARKDVFDERCVKYIFQSYGVPYYTEIPLKYQVSMMKNLNTLLKFKSTSKCMVDICSIFGFDDVRIFKYYLLRDRKLDENNEYQFNYKKEVTYEKGDPITEVRTSVIVTDGMTSITVPFPFESFVEKGNTFMVKIDDTLLSSDDYELIGTTLTFNNPEMLQDGSTVEFIFYYNEDGQEADAFDTSGYAITIKSNSIPVGDSVQESYTLDVPDGFDFSTGLFNVIIGSLWVSPNRYSVENGKITLYDFSDEALIGRNINFLYVFAKQYNLHTAQTVFTNGENSAADIIVPTPTEKYLSQGNKYYLNIAGTYISDERYGNTEKALVFLDSEDMIAANREAVFNFAYGDFETPGITTYKKSVQATEAAQRSFTVPFPFENYIERGYQLYVRVGISDLYDYQFDIFKDTLTFKDASVTVAKGQSVHFTFIYPTDFEKDIFEPKFIQATTDKQRKFTIPFPFPKFVERGNLYYVQIDGKILDSSKYEVVDDELFIYKVSDAVSLNSEILFCFYYRKINKYNVEISQYNAAALVENQDGFPIEFPFFDYLESNNSFFVTVGSTFIDESRYEVREGTLFFTDGTIIDKGRDVTFTFIYHTIYEDYDKYVNSDSSAITISKDKGITIPWPYDGFLEDEGNSMIVAVGDHIIDSLEYDIYDDKLFFADLDQIIADYGTSLRFEFHYCKITEITTLVDDNEKNYELKFVKVPLTEDVDDYIKSKSNYVEYDPLTLSDELWDGEYIHEEIKKDILNTEFSYTRTKYISIDNIEDMTRGMFDMPYFFNMFFDDLKLEDRLYLKLDDIKLNKNFRLNDTFVFMVVMAFEYNNLSDDIMDTFGKVLYLRGFNFRADIDALRTYIENEEAYDADKTPLDDFYLYKTAIRNYNTLLDIFNTNMDFRENVTHAMYNANNKYIYDIYKKIYDACLRLEYTRTFFQVADGTGTLCETYTEFLKYRDRDLYNTIETVRAISDDTTKQNKIIEIMGKVLDAINYYIDTDEYKFLFAKFPGTNTDAIKTYVELMITFFKSYKVELAGINSIYTFDDKYDNMVRPIDGLFELTSTFLKEEYMIMRDYVSVHNTVSPKDMVRLREKLYFDITYWVSKFYGDSATQYIIDKFASIIAHMLKKDDVKLNIIEKFSEITSSLETVMSINPADLGQPLSNLNYSENIAPLERIYISYTA